MDLNEKHKKCVFIKFHFLVFSRLINATWCRSMKLKFNAVMSSGDWHLIKGRHESLNIIIVCVVNYKIKTEKWWFQWRATYALFYGPEGNLAKILLNSDWHLKKLNMTQIERTNSHKAWSSCQWFRLVVVQDPEPPISAPGP